MTIKVGKLWSPGKALAKSISFNNKTAPHVPQQMTTAKKGEGLAKAILALPWRSRWEPPDEFWSYGPVMDELMHEVLSVFQEARKTGAAASAPGISVSYSATLPYALKASVSDPDIGIAMSMLHLYYHDYVEKIFNREGFIFFGAHKEEDVTTVSVHI